MLSYAVRAVPKWWCGFRAIGQASLHYGPPHPSKRASLRRGTTLALALRWARLRVSSFGHTLWNSVGFYLWWMMWPSEPRGWLTLRVMRVSRRPCLGWAKQLPWLLSWARRPTPDDRWGGGLGAGGPSHLLSSPHLLRLHCGHLIIPFLTQGLMRTSMVKSWFLRLAYQT
jgi:hypothetical protein